MVTWSCLGMKGITVCRGGGGVRERVGLMGVLGVWVDTAHTQGRPLIGQGEGFTGDT